MSLWGGAGVVVGQQARLMSVGSVTIKMKAGYSAFVRLDFVVLRWPLNCRWSMSSVIAV